jgi:uncharacterized Zn finger protein (UPF0148 family)
MEHVTRRTFPSGWSKKKNGDVYCRICRRELAAEKAVLKAPENASLEVRQKISASARLEFEVRRDPEQHDADIAKACGTSMVAVRKTREHLRS